MADLENKNKSVEEEMQDVVDIGNGKEEDKNNEHKNNKETNENKKENVKDKINKVRNSGEAQTLEIVLKTILIEVPLAMISMVQDLAQIVFVSNKIKADYFKWCAIINGFMFICFSLFKIEFFTRFPLICLLVPLVMFVGLWIYFKMSSGVAMSGIDEFDKVLDEQDEEEIFEQRKEIKNSSELKEEVNEETKDEPEVKLDTTGIRDIGIQNLAFVESIIKHKINKTNNLSLDYKSIEDDVERQNAMTDSIKECNLEDILDTPMFTDLRERQVKINYS